jgi:hypothetical protein
MAALLDGTTPRPLALPLAGDTREQQGADPAGVSAGLAYVARCLRGHRPFAIITGSASRLPPLLDRVAADCLARDELHTVRIATPTDSVQLFLAACLAQLGFELLEAALDDLHNLLVVFLRHESARGRRTVVIVGDTDHYGPRVLEFMQTLSRVRAGTTPAVSFILTGSPGLNRILDSRGMYGLRQFTRERFDLERSLSWVATRGNALTLPGSGPERALAAVPPAAKSTERSLLVTLDGTAQERRVLMPGRVVIGRSPGSDLRLDSRFVSRHHAALLVSEDALRVTDLGSTNGTLVNGETVTSRVLEHGDMLAIGHFRLRYACG